MHARRPQHPRRNAAALGHRQRHVVERGKAAEEGVDLEVRPRPSFTRFACPSQ